MPAVLFFRCSSILKSSLNIALSGSYILCLPHLLHSVFHSRSLIPQYSALFRNQCRNNTLFLPVHIVSSLSCLSLWSLSGALCPVAVFYALPGTKSKSQTLKYTTAQPPPGNSGKEKTHGAHLHKPVPRLRQRESENTRSSAS